MSTVTKQILVFLGLVVVFGIVPEHLLAHGGARAGGGLGMYAAMWAPAFAAFATCAIFRVDIGSLGWSWRPNRYVWLGYSMVMFDTLPAYVFTWVVIDGALAYDAFAAATAQSWSLPNQPHAVTWFLGIPALASMGVLEKGIRALGEEIAWRGFLFPRLAAKLGFTGACGATGVVWGAWHLPAILFTDYAGGSPLAYGLPVFFIGIIAASITYGWLRLKSKSLWPAAMMHASFNLFTQRIFDPMTSKEGVAGFFVGEFGVAVALTTCLVAFYFWRRRGELEIPKEADLT